MRMVNKFRVDVLILLETDFPISFIMFRGWFDFCVAIQLFTSLHIGSSSRC